MSHQRILILSNRVPYPLNDGGALAMHQMINGYHDAGWTVHLMAMNTSRHPVAETEIREQYRHLQGLTIVPFNTDIRPAGLLRNLLFSTRPNHADRFYGAAFADRLPGVIEAFRPDFIQVESLFLSGYLPLIRACSPCPVVLRMHNVEYQIWERLAAETGNLLKRAYLRNLAARMRRYERGMWQAYEILLPITHHDAQVAAAAAPGARIRTVPFGLPAAAFGGTVLQAEGDWTGYHLAAMDWLPNREAIEWFVADVWPEIHRISPEFRFYYAGRHMPQHLLQPKQPGLFAEGMVPDARTFIADKKILIVPLRSGGGLRIKILEALAAGKIVISTATGMQGIDAQDGVHYLRADTPAEFASAVRWCLDHPAKANELAENGRELAATHYNSTTIMTQLTDYLTTEPLGGDYQQL